MSSFRSNNAGLDMSPLMAPHDSHPSFGGLIMLVFEAVMEVVCVSLPGYVIARLGHFNPESQKFVANLNMWLFTPCLIFSKLAAQLKPDKLADLAVIPVIFLVQTLVSYVVSIGVSKAFRLSKRPANFVTAMGVFGNSNSLPISLVISLSQTLKGLHWDKIPGDNDDEVGARGILYLLIFQQLGQLVRWSWGYQVLLAPKERYEEYQDETAEEGRFHENTSREVLIPGLDGYSAAEQELGDADNSDESDAYEPAGRTPVATSSTSLADSEDEGTPSRMRFPKKHGNGLDGNTDHFPTPDGGPDDIMSFPRMRDSDEPETLEGIKGYTVRAKRAVRQAKESTMRSCARMLDRTYQSLPRPVQISLTALRKACSKTYQFLYEFMNPPLWAMLVAVLVASVPRLQWLFFTEGTFINNSVTRAVSQSAGVAVPLILVVLGANLANNTKGNERKDSEEAQIGTRLLIASLISRMLLPTLIMAPILAVFAKYVPVSILDDPIFIIVCFLLTGAPSALQLAQICQINEVYEGVMSKVLFQSYVIWILPSTLILVMLGLEVLEWAR
ncbi:Uu.00g117940.m01.CDS01 [Anthostomella pinea]|uniref:Uu.00g117940.m01.CDS01 n=1 Tax=Anthostomella pinea TaxID=933095 RepID=A0AAI8VGC2_9PEZI|nr:Uu.00g117940.m01.CDS01 [Anthostomella pinea]